jgi:hypothetical protein
MRVGEKCPVALPYGMAGMSLTPIVWPASFGSELAEFKTEPLEGWLMRGLASAALLTPDDARVIKT